MNGAVSGAAGCAMRSAMMTKARLSATIATMTIAPHFTIRMIVPARVLRSTLMTPVVRVEMEDTDAREDDVRLENRS